MVSFHEDFRILKFMSDNGMMSLFSRLETHQTVVHKDTSANLHTFVFRSEAVTLEWKAVLHVFEKEEKAVAFGQNGSTNSKMPLYND